MRRIWGFWAAAVILLNSAVSGAALKFDRAQLVQSPTRADINYSNYERVQISSTLSLPAREYLIELQTNESVSSLRFLSSDLNVIGDLPAGVETRDVPTTLDPAYAEAIRSLADQEPLGRAPLYVIGEESVDGKRYARVLVFPVTIDSYNRVCFHDSLQISISNRVADIPTERVETLSTGDDRGQDEGSQRTGQLVSGDYVIITNQTLIEAFRPLAAYKMQTGYHTSLVLIEDILMEYPGRDDAERLRSFLIDFHAQGGLYVLLGGDETVIPIRYAYHLDCDTAVNPSQLQVCDLYYADLSGDWNRDNDAVWGERTKDAPDFTPELYLGRLPVNTVDEVHNYIDKLIRYETNPGNGDLAYLQRTFFFSSDQMRDYTPETQHSYIAKGFPLTFSVDTATGVEAMSGGDQSPSNLAPSNMGSILGNGFGIVNIIAHGRDDGFAVKTSGYNTGTRAMIWTNAASGEYNTFAALQAFNKPAFYYSLACDNGAFDKSQPPFNYGTRNMAQELIAERDGAVGLVANSRWGWIGTSYILQRCFFDTLFAHPDRPAVSAMYAAKKKYSYYRDLVMGQNFFGDPTLRVYTSIPKSLQISAVVRGDTLEIRAESDGHPVADCPVLIADSVEVFATAVTDADGRATIVQPADIAGPVSVAAAQSGYTKARTTILPTITTDVTDHDKSRPAIFALGQNYPNPFNPSTTITYSLPRAERATLSVYDLLGRVVTSLVDGVQSAGAHTTEWNGVSENGSHVASGVYFYRLTTNSRSETRKMLLLK